MATKHRSIRPGDVIGGKYTIQSRIGRGGMGEVFCARHALLGERVAIKLPLLARSARPRAVEQVLREARVASRLRSVHVVRVRDTDTLPNGLPYIVMELLTGRDLARVLRDDGPLPIERAVDFVLQACEALAEAHALGIVHRDIKPSNLFLVEAPEVPHAIKVLDFGIAQARSPCRSNGEEIARPDAGSPAYMAPEQIAGGADVGFAADVWALGVVLYELLSGARPFPGASSPALPDAIVAQAPNPLRSVLPGVPAELDTVVARCLEKNPEHRYASIVELAEALAPFATDAETSMAAVSAAARRGASSSSSNEESAQSEGDATLDPSTRTESTWGTVSQHAEARHPRSSARRFALGAVAALAAIGVGRYVWVSASSTDEPHADSLHQPARTEPTTIAPATVSLPSPTATARAVSRKPDSIASAAPAAPRRARRAVPTASAAATAGSPPPFANASGSPTIETRK